MVRKNDGTGIGMINFLFALISAMSNVSQSTLTKLGASKIKTSGDLTFNAIKVSGAFILFLVLNIVNLSSHIPTFIFGLVYGILLFVSTMCGYLALKSGPMALTSLIVSYSLVIPCVYGVVFLGEMVSLKRISGFAVLVISLFLLRKKSDGKSFDKMWFLFVILTFCSNGLASVCQKMHQTEFPGLFCSEFTVVSFGVCTALFLCLKIVRKEKTDTHGVGFWYAFPAGMLMGLNNFLTLTLASKLDSAVLFPMLTIFSMIFNVSVSKLFFKDNFSKAQMLGIVFGVCSVLLIK